MSLTLLIDCILLVLMLGILAAIRTTNYYKKAVEKQRQKKMLKQIDKLYPDYKEAYHMKCMLKETWARSLK